jgi:cellulose synthase/poly-beta-1,6-N-acetylglucosamine synthase-like glycosyltransferase
MVAILPFIRQISYDFHNAGAARARGDVLLFLHVDSLVPTESLELIMKAIRSSGVVVGGFMQRFSDTDFFLTFVSNFGNLRSRLTKMFFGDSAIFLRKMSLAPSEVTETRLHLRMLNFVEEPRDMENLFR